LKRFSDFGLAEPLLRALEAEGYEQPTPIQARTIPPLRADRDVVGIAQTGTGKTAAFVLPVLDRLATAGLRPAPGRCHVLVLAPTRELAQQIERSVRSFGRFLRLRTAIVVGGAKAGPQVRALAAGVDVVVATPGRLEDHLRAGILRLDATTTVILDEADQMLDFGFVPAIRRILGRLPAERRTALFSATMPRPIRALAAEFLRDPVEVAVSPPARPVARIEQRMIPVEAAHKLRILSELLAGPEVARAIVFTRTKRGADRVEQQLVRFGLQATAIHGDKSQGQRERALGAFHSGHANILVATDIAARGLDIEGVSHVVNFELPNVPEAYVHRIGRTARAGRDGVAVSLVDAAERPLLRDIERLIGHRFEGSGAVTTAADDSQPRGGRPVAAAGPRRRARRRPRRAAPGARAGPKSVRPE
jgi:ATP-dependent RNA helicase RhlE